MALITQLFGPAELGRLSMAQIEVLKLNAWAALTEEVPAQFSRDFVKKSEFRTKYGADIDDPAVRKRVERKLQATYKAMLTSR